MEVRIKREVAGTPSTPKSCGEGGGASRAHVSVIDLSSSESDSGEMESERGGKGGRERRGAEVGGKRAGGYSGEGKEKKKKKRIEEDEDDGRVVPPEGVIEAPSQLKALPLAAVPEGHPEFLPISNSCGNRVWNAGDYGGVPCGDVGVSSVPLERGVEAPSPLKALPLTAVPEAPPGFSPIPNSCCKQFWKAGDYEGASCGDVNVCSGGIDHVRVHPKFLHSNATSHKWALGAFAELLDNSLDEVSNGATFVNVDMLINRKDGSRMLLIEDNGGGMDPDKMRHCMSLGYSVKSKIANTIGQYGNGFKTSTMRLGADVIVFSRCLGKEGKSPTQSIGLLSYTFLRSTGKEDIVVPMLDYERRGSQWKQIIRSSLGDWNRNMETILQWSPFTTETELFQFASFEDHGTRIIIYNLWEDDQGMLELDFDADPHDIQLRGVNRDEKNIQMAKQFPNSRHFLTYRHSLRSYASILYLRLPPGFRIILRGKDVVHHNIVNDMMQTERVTYKPQYAVDGTLRGSDMAATVTIGFVKDAKHHIDVQGFNVYHKNRLIKPFWRIWNAAGSDGRGVIGVLEANFVEPAHDKQGFERTIVLARLEARLLQMQKNYWTSNCQKIGYAPRRNKSFLSGSANREQFPDNEPGGSTQSGKEVTAGIKSVIRILDKSPSCSSKKQEQKGSKRFTKAYPGYGKGGASGKGSNWRNTAAKSGRREVTSEPSSSSAEETSDDDANLARQVDGTYQNASCAQESFEKHVPYETCGVACLLEGSGSQQYHPSGCTNCEKPTDNAESGTDLDSLDLLRQENNELRKRLEEKERESNQELQLELQREKDRCKTLESELEAANEKIEELNKEQETLIDIFSEEREKRDKEEENLRRKLKDASDVIHDMHKKIEALEKMKTPNGRKR